VSDNDPSHPQPRWLDDEEQAAWRAFIESVGDLFSAFESDLSDSGLTMGDYQVLVYLSEADDQALRMCDLARMLQLSPSGLTRRLDGMVTSGWVQRRHSQVDRRVMLAELTAAGREVLERAAPQHVQSVRAHLIDRLDRTQIRAMVEIFTAVSDGLRGDAGDGARRAATALSGGVA